MTIDVALATGGHPFDVRALHAVFREMDGVDFWPQSIEEFCFDESRTSYDVVVFYHMRMPTPDPEGDLWQAGTHRGLEGLGGGQGYVVLHHALLAYPQWPLWTEMVGIEDRSFGFHMDQELKIEIAEPSHPVLAGIEPFVLRDETYTMADATGDDNQVLLTVDHPRSMRTIAWTRTFRGSPVVCFQSGHDADSFDNPSFRKVLRNAIHWTGTYDHA